MESCDKEDSSEKWKYNLEKNLNSSIKIEQMYGIQVKFSCLKPNSRV